MKDEKEKANYFERRHGFSFGALFFGLLLIIIGVVYLINLAGFSINITWNWALLWPLLLIIIGLSMISRRGLISYILGSIITLVVLALFFVVLLGGFNPANTPTNESISYAQETTAKSAEVEIRTGASTINISDGATKLVEGNFQSNFLKLDSSNTVSGETQKILIATNGSWQFGNSGKNELNLKLNSAVPTKLILKTGATKINLDLTNLQITGLVIDTGASDIKVALSDKTNSEVDLSAGASSIEFSLPKTLGAKATISSGVSSKNLVDFTKTGDKTYQSNNYDATSVKTDLKLDFGASSLNINWR